jgi:hypothetical protein
VYADIAKVDSTFGGFFFDSMHVPVVYLTDVTRLVSVRAAGLDAFLSRQRNLAGTFRVLPAAYGYGTLTRWYACAWPRVFGLPDAVFTDIDEAHNRLRFGVAVASAIVGVQTIVTECGIPSAAVAVDVVPRVGPKYGLNESLQGPVRPVRGGILIDYDGPEHPCTLGIVGRTGEGTFFTTAAHCSSQPYVLDPTKYWQDAINNPVDSIGREFLDPPVIHHGDWDNCPEGDNCVFADVNMSHFQSSATNTAQVGLIARGTSISNDLNHPGSLDLDHAHPLFVTGVDTSGGAFGNIVCKTGQRSGTTCGPITVSCGNYQWAGNYAYGRIGVLCTSEADMHSEGGDSGSPIWNQSLSTSDSTVVLAGVLWGGPLPPDNRYRTFYSPFGRIVDELYWGDTVTVVADYPYVVVPSPLGVNLSGPTMMRPNVQCTWSAAAQSGTPPYTFDWVEHNYGASFSETTSGSSAASFGGGETGVSIDLTVTDANANSVYASAWAQVDANLNSNCE